MPLKHKLFTGIILFLFSGVWGIQAVTAQEQVVLSGKVTNAAGKPLPGASVRLTPGNRGAVTGANGRFVFNKLKKGEYVVEISFIGFQSFRETLLLTESQTINIALKEKVQTLQEVMVLDNYAEQRKKVESLNVEVVNDDFLKQHLGGSLMQSLARLPGISAMEIGSGQSKPAIRGLAFNRVVVVENGIKHEAQQWGADHGLEVDQFAFDRIEIIKGPSSLMYGS
ncbi:MAG: carboxypeptidase-like regulatory domain-containing protein, partial [Mariniphaga sp.]